MNKLYVLPVGRDRKWEIITQNVLRGASGPRKQKTHRARSSAKGWFVWTRWMYAKFMCSNHTNHTSYNHSHSRVNSRSRFEVSVRISWSKVCVFGRHWQATTINNGFAIAENIHFIFSWNAILLIPFNLLWIIGLFTGILAFFFLAGFMSGAFPVLHSLKKAYAYRCFARIFCFSLFCLKDVTVAIGAMCKWKLFEKNISRCCRYPLVLKSVLFSRWQNHSDLERALSLWKCAAIQLYILSINLTQSGILYFCSRFFSLFTFVIDHDRVYTFIYGRPSHVFHQAPIQKQYFFVHYNNFGCIIFSNFRN